MTNIASIMFSLMPSVDVFPIQQSITSPDGGQRLAAYKYLEYKPDLGFLDLLLSRAVGILEVPFGQFHALLSLRRMISSVPVTPAQKDCVTQMLDWTAGLPFIGSDRRALMANINRLLQQ